MSLIPAVLRSRASTTLLAKVQPLNGRNENEIGLRGGGSRTRFRNGAKSGFAAHRTSSRDLAAGCEVRSLEDRLPPPNREKKSYTRVTTFLMPV